MSFSRCLKGPASSFASRFSTLATQESANTKKSNSEHNGKQAYLHCNFPNVTTIKHSSPNMNKGFQHLKAHLPVWM